MEFAVFKNDQPSMVFMSQVSFIEIMMMMAIHQMNSEQSFFSCYILSFEHLGYKFSQQQHYTVFLFLMVPMILNEIGLRKNQANKLGGLSDFFWLSHQISQMTAKKQKAKINVTKLIKQTFAFFSPKTTNTHLFI